MRSKEKSMRSKEKSMRSKERRMSIFATHAAEHIARKLNTRKGKFTLGRFSDGEINVKIRESVRGKRVVVLSSTIPPADNIVELLLLIDALRREGARIMVLMLYFGYARQDKPEQGTSLSAQVMAKILKGPWKMGIVHAHSALLHKYVSFENLIPLDTYALIAASFDIIASPDRGSLLLAKKISKQSARPCVSMQKQRPSQEEARITALKGNVKGKKVLIIDDMITTGGTIIASAQALVNAGAREVSVLATHGIFSGDAVRGIEKSCIKKVYVTNTIAPHCKSRKINVIDISGWIQDVVLNRD